MRIFQQILALSLLAQATLGLAQEPAPHYDVVIYGGTSSGVMAAIQTSRMGKSTVLIEPSQHLGGLTTGGLGWTDTGNKAVIGGLAREFYRRIKTHYDQPAAWVHERREDYDRYDPEADAMWTFEPSVAERILEGMIAERGIPVVRGERLDRSGHGVVKEGNRLTAIVMESGRRFTGRMFIDATYEGDLLAAAGVTYVVGRESNQEYNETLNGVQKKLNTHNHRFVVPVDPYVVPGDASSGLLPGVHGGDPGEDGTGDHRVQAYCYRLCMSNVAENRVPFPKPPGYDALRYELLLRNFEAGDLRIPMKPDMMPNGKTDTNNNCAFSTDNIGMNYDYPEASYEQRERILREHEEYQKGLMWTLANHPRVPEKVRRHMAQWGLAADEFQDNGNWPHQIYVREARRMVGTYVMTEHDCRRVRQVSDSIGLGSYNMDSHNTQRYVTPEGTVQNEGDVQVSPGSPYLIAYRSIVPRASEAMNLLVPVCLSSSHIAYGSIRMEPVFMILGQSAATAAVLALERELPVQRLPYAVLRERLLADEQVLDLPAVYPPKVSIAPASLPGIVLDDEDAEWQGVWVGSTSASPFLGTGYRHDNHEEPGRKSAQFTANLPTGQYQVRLAYTSHANRATNVPVTVQHADGNALQHVDQRRPPDGDGLWHDLGSYNFQQDQPARVIVVNRDADGFVVVDGVQFLPIEDR